MASERATRAMAVLSTAVAKASMRDFGLARLPDAWDEATVGMVRSRNRKRVQWKAKQEGTTAPCEDYATAYAAANAPFVHAVIQRVAMELVSRKPTWKPQSLLNYRARVGEAIHATAGIWPSITKAEAIETDGRMAELGDKILRDAAPENPIPIWRSSLRSVRGPYDLVVAAYSLLESPSKADSIVDFLWESTQDVLVLIEKGDLKGSDAILRARSRILKRGNCHVVAPCTHDGKCPLEAGTKRCRMVQRVQRAKAQRLVLGTTRTFGDATFSFVALQKGQRFARSNALDSTFWEQLESEGVDPGHYAKLPFAWKEHAGNPLKLGEHAMADKRPVDKEEVRVPMSESMTSSAVELLAEKLAAGGHNWARLVDTPMKRTRHVHLRVCRPFASHDGKVDYSKGEIVEHVLTKRKHNLHAEKGFSPYRQARKSRLGDMWPFIL